MNYVIYSGTAANGDSVVKAIREEILAKEKGEDYFLYGTTDIQRDGVISITGDTCFLSDSLDMSE